MHGFSECIPGHGRCGRDRTIAETPVIDHEVDLPAPASMGPRSYRRGNWIQILSRSIASHRFNGAAIVRSRKRDNAKIIAKIPDELQWGRDRTIAETQSILLSQGNNKWLQWGRDRTIAET